VERWEELERRVRAGTVATGVKLTNDDMKGLEDPETDLVVRR
jgi:hypothetical protein